MSTMITRGKELIRICPKEPSRIQSSMTNGTTWVFLFSTSSYGEFHDLIDNGKEIIGTTSKGLYFSTNNGRTWVKRN